MVAYHRQYPAYNFEQHKGYGTAAHMELIHQLGPCPIHRKSFQPTKGMLAAAAAVGRGPKAGTGSAGGGAGSAGGGAGAGARAGVAAGAGAKRKK